MSTSLEPSPLLYLLGGLCGILGTLFYIVASVVSLPWHIAYALAIFWPVFSIIFAYAVYQFVRSERDSVPNQLALLFSALAFTLLAAMLSAQVSIRSGLEESVAGSALADEATRTAMHQALRLVDLGIDVAWDVFIGASLLFMAFALSWNSSFGMVWGVPAAVLGVALVVLNLSTFPWPPDTQSLLDVGPLIGVYIIAVSTRLMIVGGPKRRNPAEAA